MGLMQNVRRLPSGIFQVKKRIPPECCEAFGVREFVTISLGTRDKAEARSKAVQVLQTIDDRIAAIRGQSASVEPVLQTKSFDPAKAFAAIRDWRKASIDRAYREAWEGGLAPDTEADRLNRARLISREKAATIPDFKDRLSSVLQDAGMTVTADHHALTIVHLSEAFRLAWAQVESFREAFRLHVFTGWPEEDEEIVPAKATAPKAGLKLVQLFDLWAATKTTEPRHRFYVQRLADQLGDPDISLVSPLMLDRFLIELKRFPMTKRDVSDLRFDEVIAQAEKADPNYRRLNPKTIWNWTVVYKAMFAFAVTRDLMAKNPAANMMKKPSAEEATEREPYDADDIAAIFSTPMFTGASTDRAYRSEPGSLITRDHKYWLPILALWTGGRVEELASLTVEEIKSEDGIHFIDLRDRPLKDDRRVKNASARRVIPIHDRLIALGFLKHVAQAKTGMIFPELAGDGKASNRFTKWWGVWCEANAKTAGEGIDDPVKVFHSFRHAWKRTARQSPAKEEIHDLISGHREGNSVARGYGRGVDLKTLKAAIDEIDFPTFCLT